MSCFTHVWWVPGYSPRPPFPATKWSCTSYSLWWCSPGRFWAACPAPSGAPLFALHSCSGLETRFSDPEQTRSRHFWRRIDTAAGSRRLSRLQIFLVQTEIQEKSTKTRRYGVKFPWLLDCTELKRMIVLHDQWLGQRLSKVTSLCLMEIRELSPEKLCICCQYIRKITSDAQTTCKVNV